MKVLILAGGLGTRLSEETTLKPKPMVEIGGGKPILWHIMKIYSHYGFNDFIILTGYKGHVIKEYFLNYYARYSDITIDMSNNDVHMHKMRIEPWKVTMLYTGQDTMTGSRIYHAKDFVNNETFMLTYGDGLCDVDINKLLDFHKKHKKAITMTSILPNGRFGVLDINNTTNQINSFVEKPKGDANINDSGYINGGFFVCEPKVFDYIYQAQQKKLSIQEDPLSVVFEEDPLRDLAKDGELYAYKHHGFWKCMDTLKDKNDLQYLWQHNCAPWKKWQ
ncbi:glucose-1-phosphate cytidylyltransferase [Helicobacter anatolicus]|uniref:glucose-1-phosphate cytidylyltransferase n=1 Tax=Helicobacter anatolicus TaxID=2905874 RepID=UPI001E4C22B2|nr:glucose-1-phosphate cytidylyltransferase [Helicobacter anatolicus]MCE3037996.1 glucose-1-phosphate cytidylyltransferase [Helicobacter anatolicus]